MDGRGQLQALAVVVPVRDPQASTEYELVWPFWRKIIHHWWESKEDSLIVQPVA